MSSEISKLWRSVLFVPGMRCDRIAKAAAAKPDVVCLDLEDAVAPGNKAEARELVVSALKRQPKMDCRLILRINSLRSTEGVRDVLALADAEVVCDGIVLPKVTHEEEILWADSLIRGPMRGTPLIAIIETGAGVEQAWRIARSSRRLEAIFFGAADLSAEIGCAMNWEAHLYARSRVVQAAAAAGLDVIDVPHLDIEDEEGLRQDAKRAKDLGFVGKCAIHPVQVAPINSSFLSDAATIEWARRVVQAFDTSPDGICMLDGKLIELPVVRAMRRVLATARPDPELVIIGGRS